MASEETTKAPGAQTYLRGFGLAVILTVVPFGLVAAELLSRTATLSVIAVCAVVQVLVHLRCFLHLDLKTTPRENILAIAFAAVIIFIMIGGSLCIMFDLNQRMMV